MTVRNNMLEGTEKQRRQLNPDDRVTGPWVSPHLAWCQGHLKWSLVSLVFTVLTLRPSSVSLLAAEATSPLLCSVMGFTLLCSHDMARTGTGLYTVSRTTDLNSVKPEPNWHSLTLWCRLMYPLLPLLLYSTHFY